MGINVSRYSLCSSLDRNPTNCKKNQDLYRFHFFGGGREAPAPKKLMTVPKEIIWLKEDGKISQYDLKYFSQIAKTRQDYGKSNRIYGVFA